MKRSAETNQPARLNLLAMEGIVLVLLAIAVTGGFVLYRNALVKTVMHKQALSVDLVALKGKAAALAERSHKTKTKTYEDYRVMLFMLDNVIESAAAAGNPDIAGALTGQREGLRNLTGTDHEIFLVIDKAIKQADLGFHSSLDDSIRASNLFILSVASIFLLLFVASWKEFHRNYTMTLIPLSRLTQKISQINRSIPESIHDTAEEIRHDLVLSPHSSEISRITDTLAEFCSDIEAKNKKLDELFIRDEKTNLYNYRHFKEHLIMEIERSKKAGNMVSIAMIDIDHFKRYNDKHGHVAGDQVLEQLADVIADQCRASDMPSRFGGEEFTVLFPQTGTETAMQISERLRLIICAEPIAHERGQPEGRMTVSIGIASFPQDATDWYTLINNADRALYHAKSSGRNRVCTFSAISNGEENE
ncbi:MAG: GGDEF domain-containing protein [Chlorobium sp.]|uniref:GGDEF domain-containing protein n=1 Tax=Chlorobium sp. TaxID=1095 RepID=UPI0025B9F567|nr:GGDEF domain-containing protein [Chlorobium sp.]MCF8216801.1 GGDEF domain-containing protein [Chlorobium sp.]MCF8271552.1 GGDEF domain-containing protein [Chlorobium sp.]MCF8287924.1 GGDEF domain-containing protein [Chlorobium sp.]MCF8291602.1 GGDEF domain-containing protein [Chlorobium sp.]MCF8385593.1 GGDEF domain-containing protein [Chlorobium sp.]